MESAAGVARSLAQQARLVALACVLVDVVVFWQASPDLSGPVRAVTLVAIVLVDAAVALSPRWSGTVAVVQAAALVGLAAVLHDLPGANWTLAGAVVAAYRVGAWMPERSSVAPLALLAAGGVVAELVSGSRSELLLLTGTVQDIFIPWLIGRYTSTRRGYVLELRHNRELEVRDATAAAERAADRQRSSIARDLHDVIAHHVSAIGVHTGAARLRLTARPGADPDVVESLSAAEASSRSAMTDLRRVLDVLHRTSDPTRQIGLAHLDELLNGVRRSGLAVRLRTTGRPRELPGSVDVALYRIAQEMLTNALRYGDGTAVELHLDHAADRVSLAVRNGIGPGPGRDDRRSTGRGLAGIRSRAALFGGSASYGPLPGGSTWETRVEVYVDTPVMTGTP